MLKPIWTLVLAGLCAGSVASCAPMPPAAPATAAPQTPALVPPQPAKMAPQTPALVPVNDPAPSTLFQYTIPTATGDKSSEAFMWLPPKAKQVRGVLMVGMTLMEREFVKDSRIRAACADQQLALVFLKSGLLSTDLQKVLDDFAGLSGYRELSQAPLFFVGHSAGGPQAHDLSVKMASRCFGLMQYRGGGPYDGAPVPPGIPTLMMMGEFDEYGGTMRNAQGFEHWQRNRDALSSFRAGDENRVSSIVVEPGAGHFAWSGRNGVLFSLFLRKAAQARIPASWDAATAPKLIDISPHSGWLTDPTINAPGEFAPAPYDQYTGDKAKANWHFDEEMARAVVAYHAGGFGKKDQFVRWSDPFWVDAGTRFFFNGMQWVGDGQTFEVHPVYADVFPSPQPGGVGPRWAQSGQPVTHSDTPIQVKPVNGPIVVSGPNQFRIRFDALSPANQAQGINFMAFVPGNDEYRYTEQVGMTPRGFRGLGGKPQTITFAPLGNLKANSAPVELKATSDSGLPVEFYIAYGPATIENGKLKITDVPARATFPIPVKVVAYQFGSGVAPQVQTATPVEQTIAVEKP